MPDITKVQQAVQQSAKLPGVSDLNAKLNGEQIEIHGTAETIAARQNAMRAITEKVGDTGLVNLIEISAGSGAVTDKMPQTPRTPAGMTFASESQERTHKVERGDTLSHLAQRYYGSAKEYQKIFEANRDQLSDPDKIREGMTLRIP